VELPSSFYYIVGFLVVTNLSAIGALLMVGFKSVWFISKMHSGIDEAKSMAVRAHKRIDKLEDQ
jgi:hypothetical protein